MRGRKIKILAILCAAIAACSMFFASCRGGIGDGGRTFERDTTSGGTVGGGSTDGDGEGASGDSGDDGSTCYVKYYADGKLVLKNALSEWDFLDFAVPEKRGYTGEWAQPVTQENGDVRIDATYKAIEYSITYELLRGADNSLNPATYTVETQTFSFASPTAAGRKFLGWYADNNYLQEVTGIECGTIGKVTVYAKWEIS